MLPNMNYSDKFLMVLNEQLEASGAEIARGMLALCNDTSDQDVLLRSKEINLWISVSPLVAKYDTGERNKYKSRLFSLSQAE
jgi:hypothetical protein